MDIEHNKNNCFLLACLLVKKAGCETKHFNEFCKEVRDDLLKDKDLFSVCLSQFNDEDKKAIVRMSKLNYRAWF